MKNFRRLTRPLLWIKTKEEREQEYKHAVEHRQKNFKIRIERDKHGYFGVPLYNVLTTNNGYQWSGSGLTEEEFKQLIVRMVSFSIENFEGNNGKTS
jgi:hypothetical protein